MNPLWRTTWQNIKQIYNKILKCKYLFTQYFYFWILFYKHIGYIYKDTHWQTVPLFMEAKANIYVNCHQNWKADYVKFNGIISNGSVYIGYKGIMYKIY